MHMISTFPLVWPVLLFRIAYSGQRRNCYFLNYLSGRGECSRGHSAEDSAVLAPLHHQHAPRYRYQAGSADTAGWIS
jgi:hypothetical protein